MKREAKWYIDHCLKPPKSFFDWCYSQIHTFKWSNKTQTILASDRENCEVIEKQLRKNSVLTFDDKFYAFLITLVTSKRIEKQTWTFFSRIENGKQFIEQELTNIEVFVNDQHIQVGKWWNNYGYGLVSMTWMGGPYTGVVDYKNDWKEKLMTLSELKYIDLAGHENHINISHLYRYRREIEFLQKINAKKIADELIRKHTIDMRTMTQNWLRKNKSVLKNTNHGFWYFELENRIKQRGGKIVPGIEKYLKYSDINHIPKKARMVNFQNWIIKNKVDFKYYKDYLMLLDEMKIEADTDNLITPKDLVKAHDNAVELFNIMTAEGKTKSIEKERAIQERRIKQLKRLEATVGDLTFIAPRTTQEIINEGKQLSHCVGGSQYVDGHFKGKTTIIFVRKKESIDQPFCTLEYKSGEIVQLRGKHNSRPDNSVLQTAEKWLLKINKKRRRS